MRKTPITWSKRIRGFSLVEVLIALLVLMIALLALAGVVVSTTMVMAHTIDKEKAVSLGVETLDFLEAHYCGCDPEGEVPGQPGEDDRKFNCLSDFDKTTRTITVVVQWDGVLGSREVTLERFIADPTMK